MMRLSRLGWVDAMGTQDVCVYNEGTTDKKSGCKVASQARSKSKTPPGAGPDIIYATPVRAHLHQSSLCKTSPGGGPRGVPLMSLVPIGLRQAAVAKRRSKQPLHGRPVPLKGTSRSGQLPVETPAALQRMTLRALSPRRQGLARHETPARHAKGRDKICPKSSSSSSSLLAARRVCIVGASGARRSAFAGLSAAGGAERLFLRSCLCRPGCLPSGEAKQAAKRA